MRKMTDILDDTMVEMKIVEEYTDNHYDHYIEYSNGYKIVVETDNDPMSPREWDNVGTMVCHHRRYDLGDRDINPENFHNFEEILEMIVEEEGSEIYWLPLYLYDHSGITMSTSSTWFAAMDSGGWDWGTVGFIYVSEKKILESWMADEMTDELKDKALECLKSEVEIYDNYIRGEVYRYAVEDADGNYLDSCCGYFSAEDAMAEAKSSAEWMWREHVAKNNVQGVLFNIEES
jgi:hypothetical protein